MGIASIPKSLPRSPSRQGWLPTCRPRLPPALAPGVFPSDFQPAARHPETRTAALDSKPHPGPPRSPAAPMELHFATSTEQPLRLWGIIRCRHAAASKMACCNDRRPARTAATAPVTIEGKTPCRDTAVSVRRASPERNQPSSIVSTGSWKVIETGHFFEEPHHDPGAARRPAKPRQILLSGIRQARLFLHFQQIDEALHDDQLVRQIMAANLMHRVQQLSCPARMPLRGLPCLTAIGSSSAVSMR